MFSLPAFEPLFGFVGFYIFWVLTGGKDWLPLQGIAAEALPDFQRQLARGTARELPL